jgi:hypothetical protein
MPRTSVWVWYLTAGTLLAVTRIALFLWLVRRTVLHKQTELDYFVADLYRPESFASIVLVGLPGYQGAKYYLAWVSLITLGSFVMATPILLVGWLRQRRRR